MADLRVPEWGAPLRPTIAVEPATDGPTALATLAATARSHRWRVSPSDSDLVVRVAAPTLPLNPRHLASSPKDLWRSSVIRAEAADDGVGGCRIDVEVEDHGALRLQARTAELISAWVAALEAGGTRVRTGMWRETGADAPSSPTAWYDEGRRLADIAEREADRTPAPAPFTLTDGVTAWADDAASRCGVEATPLTGATATAWIDGLVASGLSRRRQPRPAYVLDALAGIAVADGVLRLPEPGVLRLAFTHRDRETESEDAWGWGFKPASTAALTWHSQRTCGVADLVTEEVGARAVVVGLEAVVASLAELHPGPADELRCW